MVADRAAIINRSGMQWPLVVFLFAFFGLNIATIQSFPIVWQDEVMFTEPAANLARHGSLISRAWFFDNEANIWSGNSQLYTIILSAWVKIFGVSPVAVRIFGLSLGIVGVAAWVSAVRRGGLLQDEAMPLIYSAVLVMAYGTGVNLRSGRYDTLGILIFGLVALSLTMRPYRREISLLILGIIIPVSGLYLLVPFFAGSVAALVIYGRRWIASIMCLGLGIGLGFAFLFLALWKVGLVENFIYSARRLSEFNSGIFPKDPSLILVFLAALLQIIQNLYFERNQKNIILLGAFALICTILFILMGRFPNYYSWILLFPLGLIALSRPEAGRNSLPLRLRQPVAWLLLMAVALGLPLQLGASLLGPSHDYDRINQFVARHVRSDDVALVSASGWYATWPLAAKTYTTDYDAERKYMTEAQERGVSLLVIDPALLAGVERRFGHGWRQVAILDDTQRSKSLFSLTFGAKLTWQYRLAIYRRD